MQRLVEFSAPSMYFSSYVPLWVTHAEVNQLAGVPSFLRLPSFLLRSFPDSAHHSAPSEAPFKDGFKVHVGWTQLATSVAVETRLTHGQVVEDSVSGSLRG